MVNEHTKKQQQQQHKRMEEKGAKNARQRLCTIFGFVRYFCAVDAYFNSLVSPLNLNAQRKRNRIVLY